MKPKKHVDGIRPRQPNNKEIAMQLLQGIATVMITILMIDMMFFTLWIISGQQPVDNFYFGSITNNILKAIIF